MISRIVYFFASALLLVSRIAAQETSPTPVSTADAAAATFIPWLLQGKEELSQMPLADVVFHATGKKIIAIDPQNEVDQRVLALLGTTLDEVLRTMSAPDSPIQSVARINEVSGPFENMIRERLNAAEGFSCDFPTIAGGKVQRSGYPDLRLVHESTKRVYYIDPKLFAAKSRGSSFRTFYFEPKVATNKIRDDAVHLIVGIEHEGREAAHWNFTRWDIVDLSQFKVRLKAEFQGSNRDMYRPEAIVATSAK